MNEGCRFKSGRRKWVKVEIVKTFPSGRGFLPMSYQYAGVLTQEPGAPEQGSVFYDGADLPEQTSRENMWIRYS